MRAKGLRTASKRAQMRGFCLWIGYVTDQYNSLMLLARMAKLRRRKDEKLRGRGVPAVGYGPVTFLTD